MSVGVQQPRQQLLLDQLCEYTQQQQMGAGTDVDVEAQQLLGLEVQACESWNSGGMQPTATFCRHVKLVVVWVSALSASAVITPALWQFVWCFSQGEQQALTCS